MAAGVAGRRGTGDESEGLKPPSIRMSRVFHAHAPATFPAMQRLATGLRSAMRSRARFLGTAMHVWFCLWVVPNRRVTAHAPNAR
jgi:hypothetical protein